MGLVNFVVKENSPTDGAKSKDRCVVTLTL
jgi:hypothetical protein